MRETVNCFFISVVSRLVSIGIASSIALYFARSSGGIGMGESLPQLTESAPRTRSTISGFLRTRSAIISLRERSGWAARCVWCFTTNR